MNESTQTGDSTDLNDVGDIASLMKANREQAEESTQQVESNDETEQPEIEQEEQEPEPLEADAQETDAETFETLEELAEATGMDMENFLKSIKARTKVNGEESQVSLADVIKGYQLESDYTRKNEAFLAQRNEFEQQSKAQTEQLNRQLQQAGVAFKMAQNQLTHEFNAIDWKSLESSDPQAYLLKRQQFGERQAQLDQAVNQTLQHAEQIQRNNQQQIEARERDLLLKAMPQWSDPSVRESESNAIAEFMTKNGFRPEEIGKIQDHRVFLLAHKAMNSAKAATQAEVAEKKVKEAPALIKPNARQSGNQASTQKVRQLTKRVQTGRTEDIAALMKAKRG